MNKLKVSQIREGFKAVGDVFTISFVYFFKAIWAVLRLFFYHVPKAQDWKVTGPLLIFFVITLTTAIFIPWLSMKALFVAISMFLGCALFLVGLINTSSYLETAKIERQAQKMREEYKKRVERTKQFVERERKLIEEAHRREFKKKLNEVTEKHGGIDQKNLTFGDGTDIAGLMKGGI